MKDRSVVSSIEYNYKSGEYLSQIFTLFDNEGRKIEDVHNYIVSRMRDFHIDEEIYPNLEVLSLVDFSIHKFSWRHSKLKHLTIIDSYLHEKLDISQLPSLETLTIGYNEEQKTTIRLKGEVGKI